MPIIEHHASIQSQADLGPLLLAISKIENPRQDPMAVGPRGERGLWQIKETTWKDTTGWPFRDAWDPLLSRLVAREHLLWLERQLEVNGFKANAYNMALCWRVGLEGFVNRKHLPEARDYAQRVVNLMTPPFPPQR